MADQFKVGYWYDHGPTASGGGVQYVYADSIQQVQDYYSTNFPTYNVTITLDNSPLAKDIRGAK